MGRPSDRRRQARTDSEAIAGNVERRYEIGDRPVGGCSLSRLIFFAALVEWSKLSLEIPRKLVEFIDELIDLAVGGLDLALTTGFAQVKI